MSDEREIGQSGPIDPLPLREMADTLREFGYDIDPARPGVSPGGSIVARRDLGERSVLVAVDAGGRVRAEMTWLVGEWPSRGAIGGIAVVIVDSVTRSVSVTATIERPELLARFLAGLGEIAPWAGAPGRDDEPQFEKPS
jgi:hypothetical protein